MHFQEVEMVTCVESMTVVLMARRHVRYTPSQPCWQVRKRVAGRPHHSEMQSKLGVRKGERTGDDGRTDMILRIRLTKVL